MKQKSRGRKRLFLVIYRQFSIISLIQYGDAFITDSTGDCGRGYFLCKRKRICIPSSTWCDGFRNCGNEDDTDEADCYVDPTGGWHPLGTACIYPLYEIVCQHVFYLTLSQVVHGGYGDRALAQRWRQWLSRFIC